MSLSPQVLPSTAVLGRVTRKAAPVTGLAEGTPDPELHAQLAKSYDLFMEAYERLEPWFDKHCQTSSENTLSERIGNSLDFVSATTYVSLRNCFASGGIRESNHHGSCGLLAPGAGGMHRDPRASAGGDSAGHARRAVLAGADGAAGIA